MKTVILAAGVGSRLGNPYPKTLCKLPDENTILSRQIKLLKQNGIKEIYIVVGFKMTLIMEHASSVFFKYNPTYYITNTSKSLLAGFEDLEDDLIWMNGDVIFDEGVIKRLLENEGNLIAVNKNRCGEEEIKYSLDDKGNIKDISKKTVNALGESVGINKISKKDLALFKQCLRDCADEDYFERGIELAIKKGVVFKPLDISDLKCMEIDFNEDYNQALDIFGKD